MSQSEGDNETLDPGDWNEIRELGHRMLDDVFDDLERVRSRHVWQRLPDSAKASLKVSAPRSGESLEDVYESYRENVEPYALGNRHPKFWGWVIGGGTPVGMLADMLASSMNTNAGGFEQSSAYVEKQVIDWFKEVFGFPAEATGLLVTSGSAANLTCLTVGRDAVLGSVEAGLAEMVKKPYVYASEQVHNSVDKAMGVLGLGRTALRKVRTHDDYSMNTGHLRDLIRSDRDSGARPVMVVATAGTVATGAIDDIETIADICEEEGLWLHVDGAFGAMAGLSDDLRPLVKGMNRADSLAFDLHKWMSVNFDAACVIVRNAEKHMQSFAVQGSYLAALPGGVAVGGYLFSDLGIDLSRGFRALKAWMSIKSYGFDKYARMIEKNVAQAKYLAHIVEKEESLELAAPVPLNIVCFRYVKEGASADELDEINQNILVRLQEDGLAVPSGVRIGGKFALRVANVNHRSTRADFDDLVRDVVRIGDELIR
ncbi:MAG TPA: pyridoxal-dependent decarboxylase [Gemmatimonadaceae bacterium]